MALTYANLFSDGYSNSAYSKFLIKRLKRIWPLYISITLIYTLFFFLMPKNIPSGIDYSAWGFLANTTMIQTWGITDSFVGPGWSISTEWAAYLLFPLLVSFAVLRSWTAAIIGGLCSISILAAIALLPMEVTHITHYRGIMDIANGRDFGPLARCLTEFTLGLLAYRAYSHEHTRRALCKIWVAPLIVALLAMLVMIPNADLVAVLLFPILIISLTNEVALPSRALNCPPIYFLGTISFSLYMTHTLILCGKRHMALLFGTHDFIAIIAMVIASVVIATITYYLIERPSHVLNFNEYRKRKCK